MFLDICRETKIPGVIFGDGPLRSEIEDRVKTESLDVDLRGFATYPWAEVSDKDLVIVTSKNEGDGLVVAEAVMLGIPILLLDTADLRRHKLPSDNYFHNKTEIRELLLPGNLVNFLPFRVSMDVSRGVTDSRNRERLLKQWEGLVS